MEETNVNVTPTDDTTGDQTTETPAVETKPIIDSEKKVEGEQETKESETDTGADNQEETAEFVDYDFDKDVTLPENITLSDENKTIINELGKKYNLPKEAAQEIVDGFLKATDANTKVYEAAQDAAIEKSKVDGVETMKKEWGADYDKNKATVSKAFEKFFVGTEAGEFIVNSNLAYNPHMAAAMLNIGKSISEDTLEKGETAQVSDEEVNSYTDMLEQPNLDKNGRKQV
jgi:hypothetical protein